jgi:oxygen-independent coproporphyrinogen-3 oxidase
LAFPVAVDSAGAINDFRCRVNRLLTGRWLSRCVALGDTGGDREAPGPQRYPVESRSLPEPYWSRYGFSENGDDAWKAVGERIRELSPLQAISLYVHIPFCKRRCAFCDCLSRPLRDGARESFCNALLSEITLWGALSPLRCCPVTTVHFGGGTPVSLSLRHLERIVSALRHSFGISKATEIALESTSSDLTVSNLRQLRSIGFSRIHVGVQSFDDGLRMRIGRASSSRQVSHAIEASLDAGMITSVDLVYGLPGQSRQSFIESARRACEEAVHGVSLYRFNQSGRNKEFVRRHPEFSANANADFRSFLDADDLLAGRGYKKNHFVHYAMPEDLNLYYTSPLRGEPLIAIGPTADGVIADYLYRHLDADAYVAQGAPAFCGGKEIPLHLRDVGKVGARLMCSRAERTGFAALGIEDLFDRWVKDELLTDTGLRDVYSLTGKGSWFIANMLDELELVAPNRP